MAAIVAASGCGSDRIHDPGRLAVQLELAGLPAAAMTITVSGGPVVGVAASDSTSLTRMFVARNPARRGLASDSVSIDVPDRDAAAAYVANDRPGREGNRVRTARSDRVPRPHCGT